MSWLDPLFAPTPQPKKERPTVVPQRKRRYHYSYAVAIDGVTYKNIHIAAGKLGITERTIYRMIERNRAEIVLPK